MGLWALQPLGVGAGSTALRPDSGRLGHAEVQTPERAQNPSLLLHRAHSEAQPGSLRSLDGADADRLLGGSGVSREAPAPFCERPEVKLLRPTRHKCLPKRVEKLLPGTRAKGDRLHELTRAALHLALLQQLGHPLDPLLEGLQHFLSTRVLKHSEEWRFMDKQAVEQIGPLGSKA